MIEARSLVGEEANVTLAVRRQEVADAVAAELRAEGTMRDRLKGESHAQHTLKICRLASQQFFKRITAFVKSAFVDGMTPAA